MKLTTETGETMEFDGTVAELKEKLGVAGFPQKGDWYWYVDLCGRDNETIWQGGDVDHYRLAHGNCFPTQEGLAQYKADMAKYAAIVAIRNHRDKTFGVFEPMGFEPRHYGVWTQSGWGGLSCYVGTWAAITVPFASSADIERSFTECGEHWEVLK